MNTPHQPTVRYRGVPQERGQHRPPRQAGGRDPRLILHLKAKKGSSMQASRNGAVAESEQARGECPEIGDSI